MIEIKTCMAPFDLFFLTILSHYSELIFYFLAAYQSFPLMRRVYLHFLLPFIYQAKIPDIEKCLDVVAALQAKKGTGEVRFGSVYYCFVLLCI